MLVFVSCQAAEQLRQAQSELASLVSSQRTGAQVEAEARARFRSESAAAEGDLQSQEASDDRSVHAMMAARRLGVEGEFTRAKASLAALQGDAPSGFSAGGQAQAGVPTPRNGVSWTEDEVVEMEQVSASTHSLQAA